MSGFEISSIVLGVMSGLLTTLGLHFSCPDGNYLRAVLEDEEHELHENIERLSSALTDAGQASGLLTSQQSAISNDIDSNKFEEILGQKEYEQYKRIMDGIKESVEDLHGMLIELVANVKTQGSVVEQLKRGHQQLKMRFKYNASARLVSKIKGYNSMLVSLAERVRNNMQTPDPKSLPPHKHPAFRAVRVSANRAYTALQAFHQCVCQSLHSVFLRLESRLENGSLNKEEAAEENNPRFCVLLTFEHKYPIVKNPPSTWVTFSISPPQESGNHSNAPGLGAAGSTSPAKPTAAGASCTSLSRAQLSDMKTDCIFQSLLDNRYDKFTGYLPGHHVRSLKTHPTGHKPRVVIISLRDIISRDIQKFTRRDKAHLAVILASSILQLEQTPWLRDVWGKDDIMFTECPEGPHYNYPFVKGVAGTETPTRGEEEDSIQRGRDRVLSALGLLLIEVCLGQPLQNLAPEYESSSDTIIGLGPNKGTILQLLQKVSEEGGDLYYRAVESCLYFDACTRGTGTVGDSFEANFY